VLTLNNNIFKLPRQNSKHIAFFSNYVFLEHFISSTSIFNVTAKLWMSVLLLEKSESPEKRTHLQ